MTAGTPHQHRFFQRTFPPEQPYTRGYVQTVSLGHAMPWPPMKELRELSDADLIERMHATFAAAVNRKPKPQIIQAAPEPAKPKANNYAAEYMRKRRAAGLDPSRLSYKPPPDALAVAAATRSYVEKQIAAGATKLRASQIAKQIKIPAGMTRARAETIVGLALREVLAPNGWRRNKAHAWQPKGKCQ